VYPLQHIGEHLSYVADDNFDAREPVKESTGE
jgi:hypothetical protein